MKIKYVSGYCAGDGNFELELENAVSQIQQVTSSLSGKKYLGKIQDIKCWGVSGSRSVNYALILWDYEEI